MDFTMCLLLLVNFLDFKKIMLNNGLVDPLFIVVVRSCFDLNFKVWILWKEGTVQEFGTQGETTSVIHDHVDKITFHPVDNIMIANYLITLLFFRDLVTSPGDSIAN